MLHPMQPEVAMVFGLIAYLQNHV